jgi:hypothetical protein
MKYGYLQRKNGNGKHGPFIPHVEGHSGSPSMSEAADCQFKSEVRVDDLKARAASVPSHSTFG